MAGNDISRAIEEQTVTIASGSTSQSFSPGVYILGTYQIPSAFTGATVTINYSNDGSNWTAVPTLTHESNPETVAANGTYLLPSLATGAKFVQFVSASSETADRAIKVFLKG